LQPNETKLIGALPPTITRYDHQRRLDYDDEFIVERRKKQDQVSKPGAETASLAVRLVNRGIKENDMNQIIVDAIRKRRRLRFTYNQKTRIVEPQCYGIGTKGTELLRVYQVQGGAEREPLFDVSKIEDLVVLDEVFTQPGPNYKKNDSAMATIFCQL
jgi:predicted DNA-binding transcriptional regulator YafY